MTNVGAISGLQKPEGTEVEIKRKHAVLILGPPCSGKKNVRECLAGCGFYSYSSSEALSEYGRNYNPRVLQAMDSGDDVDIVDVIRVSGWQYQDFLAHREPSVVVVLGAAPLTSFAKSLAFELENLVSRNAMMSKV